jgi:hypothetical protein
LAGVIAGKGAGDLIGHRLCFARQQVAANPLPDRIERDARDASGMMVRGGVVDQERFERLKEKPREIPGPRRRPARLARRPAQFLQHELGAGGVVAAQQAPLKLGNQQSPRFRFQVPEILPQTLHEQPVGHPATHFSHTRKKFDSARALRTR